MIVDFYNETDIQLDNGAIDKAKSLALLTLKEEGFTYDSEISLTAVSKERIKELNRKYRNTDKETDVLSFPCYSLKPGDFNELASLTFPVILGDIVICVEKAAEQAALYGHSFLRELCFLVCHSTLHLLGYDHISKEGEDQMLLKQTEILNKAGILR